MKFEYLSDKDRMEKVMLTIIGHANDNILTHTHTHTHTHTDILNKK